MFNSSIFSPQRLSWLGSSLRALLVCALLNGSSSYSWAQQDYTQDYSEDYSEDHQQDYAPGGDDEASYGDQYDQDVAPSNNYEMVDDPDSSETPPSVDPDMMEMVREVQTSCNQWAAESGLEGEELQVFVDDCVYSQTGQ